MSIIPKPGWANKYCILQNYSFPINLSPTFLNPSVNSTINSSDSPTTWGTFTATSFMLTWLPPNSEIATRDISEAYCTAPIHYTQWPTAVIYTGKDAYCINTTVSFGVKPSGGCYGDMCDTLLTIIWSQGISPIIPWVNNHLFARIPTKFLSTDNNSRAQTHADITTRGGKHQTGGLSYPGVLVKSSSDELQSHLWSCLATKSLCQGSGYALFHYYRQFLYMFVFCNSCTPVTCHILEIWLSPTPTISGHLRYQLRSCVVTSPYTRKVIFL